MLTLFAVLVFLLVLAIVALAVWLWLFIDIVDQVAALIRIKVEEQVALWRIDSIIRITQAEQRRMRDEHQSH
jgi:type II secretory pathway component PulJ